MYHAIMVQIPAKLSVLRFMFALPSLLRPRRSRVSEQMRGLRINANSSVRLMPNLVNHLTLTTHGKPQLRSTTSMTATATAALPLVTLR